MIDLLNWKISENLPKIKIDQKDKKLLFILLTNARITLKSLAKELNISKVAVYNRIQKLERKNIIRGYSCFVNLQKLGFTLYQINVNVKTTIKKKEHLFAQLIQKNSVSQVIELSAGKWDFLIRFYGSDKDLSDVVQHISQLEGIEEINVSKIKTIKVQTSEKIVQTNQGLDKFDVLDLKILQLLAKNSRTSILDLATKVGSNISTVRKRMRTLEKSGIILFYVTAVDFYTIGLTSFISYATVYGSKEENNYANMVIEKYSTGAIITLEYPNIFCFHVVETLEQLHQIEKKMTRNFPNVKYELNRIEQQNYYNFFPEQIYQKLKHSKKDIFIT